LAEIMDAFDQICKMIEESSLRLDDFIKNSEGRA